MKYCYALLLMLLLLGVGSAFAGNITVTDAINGSNVSSYIITYSPIFTENKSYNFSNSSILDGWTLGSGVSIVNELLHFSTKTQYAVLDNVDLTARNLSFQYLVYGFGLFSNSGFYLYVNDFLVGDFHTGNNGLFNYTANLSSYGNNATIKLGNPLGCPSGVSCGTSYLGSDVDNITLTRKIVTQSSTNAITTFDSGLPITTNYNLSLTSNNYFTRALNNINISNANIALLYPTKSINLSVYYSNNASPINLGSATTVLISSNNGQQNLSIGAGNNSVLVSNLNDGEEYFVQVRASGYATSTVSFTHTVNTTLLQQKVYIATASSVSNMSIITYETGNVALNSVYVTAEQYINNTWTVFSSGYTDNAGKVIVQVDTSNSVRLTFAKEGYVTKTQVNTPALVAAYVISGLSVIMDNSNTPSMINSATYVDWSYTPTNSTITANDAQNFIMALSIQQGTLEYGRVRLYVNGSVLDAYQYNSTTGGQFGITVNTTKYINQSIVILYEYKKPNFALVQNIRGYFIVAVNQSQPYSIQRSQDWIKTVDIDARILYWFASIIVFIILLITFIRNMSVIAIGATGWAVAWGYYFLPEAFMYISLFAGMLSIILIVSRSRQ